GVVPRRSVTGCLLAHRDPRLLEASDEDLEGKGQDGTLKDQAFLDLRERAKEVKAQYLDKRFSSAGFHVADTEQVKNILKRGDYVTLDIDFYYGAWNHREAADGELGIGRNLSDWARGIVGYPEADSLDVEKSREKPAGHSVLIVGYDDTVKVRTTY